MEEMELDPVIIKKYSKFKSDFETTLAAARYFADQNGIKLSESLTVLQIRELRIMNDRQSVQ